MPQLLSRSSLIAAALVIAIGIWLSTGPFVARDDELAPVAQSDEQPVMVEAQTSHAQTVQRFLQSQGQVLAFRRVIVRAETAGRIAGIALREGTQVNAGDQLVQLSLEARESELANATAQVEKLEQDLENARRLLKSGATPRQRVRELETQVAAASAAVDRIREEIDDTSIVAPFEGVVNEINVETGQFVSVGDELVTLIDNDPLKVEIQVPQQLVQRIERGAPARVAFATGRVASGRICFVSAAANPGTRTLAVEIRVANPGNETPSRISAEARIPTGQVAAHRISPALLSLGPDGDLGVKAVSDGRVIFHRVRIERSARDGVWVSGLPDEIQLITRGQGFVRHGDTVRIARGGQSPDVPRDDSGPAASNPAGDRNASRRGKDGEIAAEDPPSCNAAPPTRFRERHSAREAQTARDKRPSP